MKRLVKEELRPTSCPACRAGRGHSRRVAVFGAVRTTSYACDHCQHHWKLTMKLPAQAKAIWGATSTPSYRDPRRRVRSEELEIEG